MKNIVFMILCIYSFSVIQAQEAIINNVTCSKENNLLQINVNLNILDSKGEDVTIIAYFYDKDKNGLRDRNNRFYTSDKYVCVTKSVCPRYENSHYNNVSLEIPLSELHIQANGWHQLYFKVCVYTNDEFIE